MLCIWNFDPQNWILRSPSYWLFFVNFSYKLVTHFRQWRGPKMQGWQQVVAALLWRVMAITMVGCWTQFWPPAASWRTSLWSGRKRRSSRSWPGRRYVQRGREVNWLIWCSQLMVKRNYCKKLRMKEAIDWCRRLGRLVLLPRRTYMDMFKEVREWDWLVII